MSIYLVTGGAGFVGSHIVNNLIENGKKVRVLDNLSTGDLKNLQNCVKKIEFVKGDIRSKNDVTKALKNISYVLHLAAFTSVNCSIKNPLLTNDVNINGTLNLLISAKRYGVKKVVFASSCAVYGNGFKASLNETVLPNPLSPYAASKLSGEYYCKIFSQLYGLETIILRYFNIFGPGQPFKNEYSVVIPKFINCLIKNRPLPIYGSGKQVRDFVYIDDVVRANMLVLNSKKTLKGRIFNIASGKNYSILDLAFRLSKKLNRKAVFNFKPTRDGDIWYSRGDIALIKKELNWKPLVDFNEGLAKTVADFK